MRKLCLTIIRSILIFLAIVTNPSIADIGKEENTSFNYCPPPKEKTCLPWDEIAIGEYLITNNIWGARGQRNSWQCISAEASPEKGICYSWLWNWQGRHGDVIAYPSVLYGHKPWNRASTSTRLPIQLAQLGSAEIDYQIRHESQGSFNVLLEAWVTSSKTPLPHTRTAEIAIHLYQQDWPGMPGKVVETVNLGGHNYDFYVEPSIVVPGDNHRWAYLGFVRKPSINPAGTEQLAEKLDFGFFIHYLIEHGYINQQHYLSSFELGTEIVEGKGYVSLDRFSVEISVKTK